MKKQFVLSLVIYLLLLSSSFLFAMSDAEMRSKAVSLGINPDNPQEIIDYGTRHGVSKERIESLMQKKGISAENTQTSQVLKIQEEPFTLIEDIKTESPKEDSVINNDKDTSELKLFGYELFKGTPDAFKPSAVGLVDPGYVVGPGDVLHLAVWGEAEFQYEFTVSKEGKVFIPKVGQVFVTGVNFENLTKKIRKILSRRYSGLAKKEPTIFMDLSIAKLKPVRIFIMGEVDKPGGYTVSSYASVFNALYSIGGPKRTGSLRNIKVFRNNKQKSVVDIYQYLLKGHTNGDIRLQNNDVVFIPPRKRTVAIKGETFRSAVYELKEDENLKTLIDFAGGIVTSTNSKRIQVVRTKPYNQRDVKSANREVIDVNLERILNSKASDFKLYDSDTVLVFKIFSDLKNYVELKGAVKYPGRYQAQDLTLKELICKQGQIIAGETYTKRIDVVRLNEDLSTNIIRVSLEELKSDTDKNIALMPGDQVFVYDIGVEKDTDKWITVEGEVRFPCTVQLSDNMTLSDALLRAGGFTRKAYRKDVEISRIEKIGFLGDTLSKIFKVELLNGLEFDNKFSLHDRDRILVRRDPNYREQGFVTVEGNVKYAGRYAIEKRGERLANIISRAGGFLSDGFPKGAKLTRGGERLVVNFENAIKKPKGRDNVILFPNDIIYVPTKPNVVYVSGEVNNKGLFSFVKGNSVKDYIKRAGGLTDSSQYIFLTKPNGETQKLGIGFFASNPKVSDGSKIFVSKKQPTPVIDKSNKPSIGETIKDMFAIATSAVTLIILTMQIQK